MNGQLGYFQYIAITNNASINNLVCMLFHISGGTSPGKITRSEIAVSKDKNLAKPFSIGIIL